MLVPTGTEGKYEYDPSIPAPSGGGGDITVESLSATENKTYTAPAGKAYSPVVVNVSGGGGGGGDLSTARVTLKNSAESKFYTYNMTIINKDLSGVSFANITVYDETTVEIPLYKGTAYVPLKVHDADESVMPVMTGDITLDMPTSSFKVTGDGSITFAGVGEEG